ncbi:MAG: hypothetical protein AAF561_06195 [Planctomycetota bacterium]
MRIARRGTRSIGGAMVASVVLHASLIAAGLYHVGWSLGDGLDLAVVQQTLPDNALGTPGQGEAFLEKQGELPELASRLGRQQPRLLDSPASPPSQAAAVASVAEALETPATPEGLRGPLSSDAASLAFTDEAASPTEDESADAEPSQPSPPMTAGPSTDRESPAVSPRPVPVIDIRTGAVVSGGKLDFKPRLLRAGLSAYADRVSGRTMRLQLEIDRTGRPIIVMILRASGSRSVDALVERSLFEWWFNPDQQASGEPFVIDLRL